MATKALCIGINDYPGTDNDLSGCVNDANDWAEELARRGFAVSQLLDKDARRAAMIKAIGDLIDGAVSAKTAKDDLQRAHAAAAFEVMGEKDLGKRIKLLEKQMLEHARNLEFEKAAAVRDQLAILKEQAFGAPGTDNVAVLTRA